MRGRNQCLEAREVLARAKDADFQVEWSLKMGDQVLFTSTRGEVVRQNINHLAHHRGQLSVCLRLIDVPVPSIHGPTADEGWQAPKKMKVRSVVEFGPSRTTSW